MRALLIAVLCVTSSTALAGGDPLTVTIVNPARAEAMAYRVKDGKLDALGVIHAGGSLQTRARPGDVLRVDFNCRRRTLTYKVPRKIVAEWKLPSKPCAR